MGKQMIMLIEAIKFISSTEGIDNSKAFNKLLQWCGLQLGVTGTLFKAKESTHTYLSKEFDVESLKGNHDWIGELYIILGLYNGKAKLISHEDASTLADKIIAEGKGGSIPIYLDTNVGTGRTLASMYEKTNGKFLLYGVEQDKTLYRICLINFALQDVKAKVIQWNDTIDLGTLSPTNVAWDRANNWCNKIG